MDIAKAKNLHAQKRQRNAVVLTVCDGCVGPGHPFGIQTEHNITVLEFGRHCGAVPRKPGTGSWRGIEARVHIQDGVIRGIRSAESWGEGGE